MIQPYGQKLLGFFLFVCVAFVLIDPFVAKEHAAFTWEKWPGFYAAFGFFSCSILVLVSKHILRPLVMRDEEEH